MDTIVVYSPTHRTPYAFRQAFCKVLRAPEVYKRSVLKGGLEAGFII